MRRQLATTLQLCLQCADMKPGVAFLLQTIVLNQRVGPADQFRERVTKISARIEPYIALDDLRLAGRAEQDQNARVRHHLPLSRNRGEDKINGLSQTAALRNNDDGAIFDKRGVERCECFILVARVTPEMRR